MRDAYGPAFSRLAAIKRQYRPRQHLPAQSEHSAGLTSGARELRVPPGRSVRGDVLASRHMSYGPWRAFLLLATSALLLSAGRATPRGQEQSDQIVLVGAGDIANCDLPDSGAGAVATGKLIDSIPGTVFTLGDHAYPSGTADQFRDCYEPRWGKVKVAHAACARQPRPADQQRGSRTSTTSARRPGRTTRLLQLRSRQVAHRLAEQRDSGRQQVEAARVAAEGPGRAPTTCTLAYWHNPRFSSGAHGSRRDQSGCSTSGKRSTSPAPISS